MKCDYYIEEVSPHHVPSQGLVPDVVIEDRLVPGGQPQVR